MTNLPLLHHARSINKNYQLPIPVLKRAITCGLLIASSLGCLAQAAPAPIKGLNNPNRIPGQYVVVLKSDLVAPHSAFAQVQSVAQQHGFVISQKFATVFNGFLISSTTFSPQAISAKQLDAIANDPDVAFIEADQMINLEQPTSSAFIPDTIQSLSSAKLWGLDRINQAKLPLDNSYSFNATGAKVHAYIIDSGINLNHQEFKGRIADGVDFVKDGNGVNDCRGHGTHVAGIMGGKTYGVAKEVTLHPVRVFGCSTSAAFSSIVAAVEWVINNHQEPALLNLSLGGRRFDAVDIAAEKAVEAGVSVIVSAGNDASDACTSSPAGAKNVIAVGASDINDIRAPFSNIGKCVSIFAPGFEITSAWVPDPNSESDLSGTSMAAPYVAGVVARYLEKNPSASPAKVKSAIVNGGTREILTDVGTDSPNLLLNSEIDGNSQWQRTVVFIYGQTQPGQDMFIRGGIDHTFASHNLGLNCTKENMLCAIPMRHLNSLNPTTTPWKNSDDHLDWYGVEATQDERSQGSPLDWTTNFWPPEWGTKRTINTDGYGETLLNLWGHHYWMLDVELDCSKTVNGWFELKSFISNGPGWESDVAQPNAPYSSRNHFAQCGKVNVFRRGQHSPVAISDF